MKNLSPKFVLTAITVAGLAPFLGKAFHIDDPLFLWMAEQISKHPLDPYGFDVNWVSSPQPMWMVMQNPPFCSYLIAAVATILGWSEVALHLAFLLPAVAAVVGTYAIARRLCADPTMAGLLALFTPAFLVSATNLMCDVVLLACWVWSIEFWLAGLERNKTTLLLSSSLLAAVAVLTKYFGIALVPLLATYTIVRDRRLWPRLAVLFLPVAVTVGYEVWTTSQYGRGLFAAALAFTHTSSAAHPRFGLVQLFTGFSFLGGSLFPAVFFFPYKSRKLLAAGLGAMLVMLVTFYFLGPPPPKLVSESNRTAVWIEAAIFATIGAGIITLALADLIETRRADSVLLTFWVIGTFCFATFCNWSITVRTILPMVPAAAILLVRRLVPVRAPASVGILRYWRVFPAAFVSLLIAAADYRQANSARDAADSFRERFRTEKTTVWFQSHWGFQYYMQKWGAKPWDTAKPQTVSGNVLVIPLNSTPIVEIPWAQVFRPEKVNFATLPLVTTFGRGTGASYYSSVRGPVPWAIDAVPAETYYVARFR